MLFDHARSVLATTAKILTFKPHKQASIISGRHQFVFDRNRGNDRRDNGVVANSQV